MIRIIESKCNLLDIKKSEDKILKIINLNRDNIDINYLSEYLYLHSLKKKNTVIYFLYKEGEKFFLNILLKNSINISGFKNFFDLETPYGYGGPLFNSHNKIFLKKANYLFDNWCKENFILCQLTRFNPLLTNVSNFVSKTKKLIKVKKIGIFNLTKNKINLINYDSKTRNMIKRNLNNEVEFKVIDNNSYDINQLKIFKENYLQSMLEKNAKEFYFFNEDYFQKITLLIKNKKAFIINALQNNLLIAGAIFLYNHNIGYYHLSFQKKYPGIMNTIIYKSTQILFNKNINYLILGGGNLNSDEDNLFKFKLKMSNMVNFFYIETKIFNSKIYNKICIKLGVKNPKKLLFYRDYNKKKFNI